MNPVNRSVGALVACCVVTLSLVACVQTSRISTKPEGAEIWVNNQYLGKSPVSYTTRSGFPATYYLKAKLPGYEALDGVPLDKSYRADISLLLLIPGIIPYFFSARLEDQYTMTLRAGDGGPEK